jgi:hypothetical protein
LKVHGDINSTNDEVLTRMMLQHTPAAAPCVPNVDPYGIRMPPVACVADKLLHMARSVYAHDEMDPVAHTDGGDMDVAAADPCPLSLVPIFATTVAAAILFPERPPCLQIDFQMVDRRLPIKPHALVSKNKQQRNPTGVAGSQSPSVNRPALLVQTPDFLAFYCFG